MSKMLGKLAPRHDPRTFKLQKYLPKLPPLPIAADWSQGRSKWGQMLNDSLGDCTCAAAGHLIMNWSQNAANLITPSDGDILVAYKTITGYHEDDPNSDTGAVELDVLNFWRKQGIGGHKIDAFVKLEHQPSHLKAAIHLFGGFYGGVLLPDNFERQFENGQRWELNGEKPNPESGHAIPAVAYNEFGVMFLTWGTYQWAAWDWVAACMDEAYAVYSRDFFLNGQAPNGFDAALLTQDLQAL